MSAPSAPASMIILSRSRGESWLPVVCHAGPSPEGRWRRALRRLADRRHLREMDPHLLRDVGLTREDVLRGTPFRKMPSTAEAGERAPAMVRLGTLEARGWRLKLYAPASEAAGLRREDLAVARRVFSAALAEPGLEPVVGFAVLATVQDEHLPHGALALTACRWDGAVLRRSALLVPVENGPVRRVHDDGLGVAELLLAARECRAWQRHVAGSSPSSLAAYVAEDCS